MTGWPLLLDTLPQVQRDRLFTLADERDFRAGSTLFDEGGVADRFWLIRSGEVALDVTFPGAGPRWWRPSGRGSSSAGRGSSRRTAGIWALGRWERCGPGSFPRPRCVSCAWPTRSSATS
ncbi:cyclic nucleotide-binding domain-containing protein [Streptomyces malaysiensis subsp. malaysiensis]